MDFKLGDRVIYKTNSDFTTPKKGDTGTIVEIYSRSTIGIRFDEPNELYWDLGGLCEKDRGYRIFKSDVESYNPKKSNLRGW